MSIQGRMGGRGINGAGACEGGQKFCSTTFHFLVRGTEEVEDGVVEFLKIVVPLVKQITGFPFQKEKGNPVVCLT